MRLVLFAIAALALISGSASAEERERSLVMGGGQRTYLMVAPDKPTGPLP